MSRSNKPTRGAIGETRQFRGPRRRDGVVAKQQFDDPTGALGPQFGLDGEKLFGTTRQLSGQNVSLLGGRRVSVGRGVAPIRIGRTRTLAAWAATRRRMGDRRREQRNRRVPAKSSRQGEVGEPQRENLGVDLRRGAKQFHRHGARARGRRERISASVVRSRKASANPSKLAASERPRRSAAVRSVGASSREDRRAKPRHSRCMRPAGLVGAFPPALGDEMLGVAQRGRILAMARQVAQAVAARNARRCRSAPANGGSARRI